MPSPGDMRAFVSAHRTYDPWRYDAPLPVTGETVYQTPFVAPPASPDGSSDGRSKPSGVFVRTRHPNRQSLIHWWPYGSRRALCGHTSIFKSQAGSWEIDHIEAFSCKQCLRSVRALEQAFEKNTLRLSREVPMKIRVDVPRSVAAGSRYLAVTVESTIPEVLGKELEWLHATYGLPELEAILRGTIGKPYPAPVVSSQDQPAKEG
jgi:hypothetical protein